MIETKKSELKNDMKETNQQIYELIEQANQQLQQLFNKREEELLKIYKQEMLNVQRQLIKIRDEESQTEIEKRIQKHREELAKERELYLEKSIKLSENIKELSILDREIRQSFNEFQSEIKFLDEQLIYADKHNIILQEELNSLGEEEQQFQREIRRKPKSMNQLQSVRLVPLPQIKRTSCHLQQEQELNNKLKQQINQVDEEELSEFEKYFDESILKITELSEASTNIDLTCCNEFSEYQKRRIFEEFLEKPYTRGKIPKCQICSKSFSFTQREHQCKRCIRAVCEACSPFKMNHVKKDGKESTKPHRMCKICKDESDYIKNFVDSNRIAYGVDTLSKQWLGSAYNEKEYKAARESAKIKLDKTEISGLDNINYSLKEFYYLVGKDQTKLQNVCMTFCSKNPEYKFTAELVCLANFLLCFSSEASAYQLLCQIYKSKPKEDCLITILTYCVKGFNLNNDDQQLLKTFLKSRLQRYLITFSINMFNFDTTVFLISQFANKFEAYLKALSAIFMIASPQLKNSTHEDFELWILRNVRGKEAENKLQSIQLPQPKQDAETRQPSQSIRSLAFSMLEQPDNSLIADLRAEISNLRLQLALKENEVESYKFQLQQAQNPDDQKKDKFIKQKNDEIAILLSRVDALTLENQSYQKKEASVQNQNQLYQDSQKVIQEQQRQIERLKTKIKESNFETRAMSMSLAGGAQGIMSGKEVQELKIKHEEEKQQLAEQIQQLETQKNQLQRIIESQKLLNQRVVDYISSMTINTSVIELSVKPPLQITTRNDNDDYKYLIDTKNQQNQLLKQLLVQNQQQIQDLNNKLKDIKSMIYSQ